MNRPSTSRRAQGGARRDVGLPGESFLFEVADLGSSHQDIAWSGGESLVRVRKLRFQHAATAWYS